MPVYRIYTEKRAEFATEAKALLADLRTALRLDVLNVRILNRYDADHISREDFKAAVPTVFSEPAVDSVYDKLPLLSNKERIFAAEYLPGQFDQRADSCEQCIQILNGKERCRVRHAKVYILSGQISDADFERVKAYLINPVDSVEASLEELESLDTQYDLPETVETLHGFCEMDRAGRERFLENYALAMDMDDLAFCQSYFRDTERRDPTITEIRVIDTYWSDHCRHTTFLTQIDNAEIEPPYIQNAYDAYLRVRKELGRGNKPVTLMDLATAAMRKLKADGKLSALDESEEINACSVKIKVETDSGTQDWVLMFKNETHNHPTEIEPFGGAATCLGGAIRDPLSGRSYVYQAMRVTGAANPLVPVSDTMPGKLPQRKITIGAANGYSSYGNQIGLATGHVSEIYHPGYAAKRMEIGAVLGAAPAENIRREAPVPGDVIILLGGKTGRDGCGGATGSSKSHTLSSLTSCGAEVQKGNAPEERKLQRLFRDKNVTRLIKRCNDFGAGGVSVAIGELTDGLEIDLNAVPRKYDGLDGTELAISESQERMAVVVAAEDADTFLEAAEKENLLATPVAKATDTNRLRMHWNGAVIVDLSREFLNSNGAPKHTRVLVETPVAAAEKESRFEDTPEGWAELMGSLRICSQKGLVERFDSTIGAGTVLMPFGGAYQLTPAQAMAAKIPVPRGETTTCSIMGWGFDPELSERSPFHGAQRAVIESVAKVLAAGGSRERMWLTFQEYFPRTRNDPRRWGKPFAALLGAFQAQMELSCASIGGKDSMSGSFESVDVPPTLVSFAVSVADARRVISAEFKAAGDTVIRLAPEYSSQGLPDWASVRACFDRLEELISSGRAKAVWAVGAGGVAEGIAKMAFGNHIGFEFSKRLPENILFSSFAGSFLVELDGPARQGEEGIGRTNAAYKIFNFSDTISLDHLQKTWEGRLESVFPCRIKTAFSTIEAYKYEAKERPRPVIRYAKPRVVIPVFPGTNCEYDTARAFERAGAVPQVLVIRNLSPRALEDSVSAAVTAFRNAQMIMIPGGFSGGDEPDGSGKFITAFFRNPQVAEAVNTLLQQRDGLMLGICNGFQALVKLGLVPFGEIREMTRDAPTLTFNTIARHQSMMVTTRVASNKSPWLQLCEVGQTHCVPISHGEGRFIASETLLRRMAENGQIATQYVDFSARPTMDIRFNPNGSADAVEGITSPDGRVFGKMGHSERAGAFVCANVPGEKDQRIFESGVLYFS